MLHFYLLKQLFVIMAIQKCQTKT